MSQQFIELTPEFYVSGQLQPEDLETAKAQGVTLIINNRPDGEGLGQPTGETIADAAHALGLEYINLPVGPQGISKDMLDEWRNAVEATTGKTLAYCGSGMRSAALRAIAKAAQGADPDELIAQGAAAGFNLSGVRPMMSAAKDGAF